jgi:ketopantoate reductase
LSEDLWRIGQPERHAVLGAGGIGGLIGTMLSAGGVSITAIARPETVAEYPNVFTLEPHQRSRLKRSSQRGRIA